MKSKILLFLSFILIISACRQPDSLTDVYNLSQLSIDSTWNSASAGSPEEIFQEDYMSSFNMVYSEGEPTPSSIAMGSKTLKPFTQNNISRATVSLPSEGLSFADSTAGTQLNNYPEAGMTTTWIVTEEISIHNDVWKIEVTSTYPVTTDPDLPKKYTETYYVYDITPGDAINNLTASTPDGIWTIDDPIVDNTGVLAPNYRVTQEILFNDDSIRYEQVILQGGSGYEIDGIDPITGFAYFDINETLDFPGFTYPAEDSDAVYSSIVIYYHERATSPSYNFWSGTTDQNTLGIRFYTEHYVNSDTQYVGTLVAYEKVIEGLTTSGGDLIEQMTDLFIGSANTTLAESVIRREVLFNVSDGVIGTSVVGQNTVMRSLVMDITGNEQDFQLQILNGSSLKTKDFDVDAFFSIPDSASSSQFLQEKTGNVNPDGTIDVITQSSGTGDLAALYELLGDPLSYEPVATTDSQLGVATIDPPDSVLVYTGGVGTVIGDPDASDYLTEYALSANQGTVEAWININKINNYAGILHKGIAKDWSDESYSMQFWGRRGQIAFAAVVQDPRYRYDKIVSRTKLKTGQWYYVVATWDAQNTDTMSLYIYGTKPDTSLGQIEKKTVNLKHTVNGVNLPGGPLVLGSQLADPNIFKLKDFYGFDGKINGVRISQTAKSEADITSYYNEKNGHTSTW